MARGVGRAAMLTSHMESLYDCLKAAGMTGPNMMGAESPIVELRMGCIEIMIGEMDGTCLEHFQIATPAYVHRIRIQSNIFNVQILQWSMEGHRKRQAHHLASAVASMVTYL